MSILPSLSVRAARLKKQTSNAIAFVDSRIEHHDHWVQGMTADMTIMTIPTDQDGVRYITRNLSKYQENYRIYIVAHGEPGALFLGSTTFSLKTLEQYSWDIQSWFSPRAHLTQSALILYSFNVFNVGQGQEGATFLRQLRQLCGVAIAASSIASGDAPDGDHWEWDHTMDRRNVVVPFRPRTMDTYAGVL